MKKQKLQQASFGFDVQTKATVRHEKHQEKIQYAEVLYTGELGLNANWKNFGDYIKNKRGNKV